MRYKIVPVEPTGEMSEAGHDAVCDDHDQDGIWRYMLDAAPKASEDEELVERVAMLLTMLQLQSFQGQARAVLKMLEGADHEAACGI